MNALADPPLALVIDAESAPAAVPALHAHRAPANVPAATPAYLLQLAVQQGADLDRLEKLMGLHERWEANEARKAFVKAMADFKREPLEIFKRKAVGYETKDGEWVGYMHAELSDVVAVVVPALAKHGLSHRWAIRQADARVYVDCIVTHELGHSESVTMDAAPDASGKKNAIQSVASSITYCERYTLLAITGLTAKGLDDDGQGAGCGAGQGAGGDAPPWEEAQQRGEAPRQPVDTRPTYPADRFATNLPEWRQVIASGRKTADQLIAWLEAKHPLSADQKAALRAK